MAAPNGSVRRSSSSCPVEVVVLETEQERADLVADAVVALVSAKPAAVLGLATGSSPSPVYAELVRRYQAGEVSFAHASAFTLDEYLGLPPGHPEGYRQVIEREFASLDTTRLTNLRD